MIGLNLSMKYNKSFLSPCQFHFKNKELNSTQKGKKLKALHEWREEDELTNKGNQIC